ncbi:hypothetical protein [Enterovirga aerilata]|uniref:Uncharacterized protein n=1 Tax=Enterovirga aerilata TaxID=2730920 RepID=A0A849ICU2_9HYPH|nr:hypothetical protein [Enterovirga sp. DB1703]NNM74239.1 hypothetical protein [Enterovirga sp. DB1703]
MVAPDISRKTLALPLADRPAYDATTFAAALRSGVSPSGRPLARQMPRYGVDEATAAEMWTYLDRLELVERSGVRSNTVTVGVAENFDADRVYELERALALSGGTVHGRRIVLARVDPHDKSTWPGIVAVLFSRDNDWISPESPPSLFPLSPVAGTERADEVRALVPPFEDQLRAVAAEAPRSAPVVAAPSDRATLGSAQLLGGREFRGPEQLVELMPVAIVLGSDAWRMAALHGRAQSRFYGLGHEACPFQSHLALKGASVSVTRAACLRDLNASSAGDRGMSVAASVLTTALAKAGRDLTRGSLMRGFSSTRYDGNHWARLDYTRYPVTGTRAVEWVHQ